VTYDVFTVNVPHSEMTELRMADATLRHFF